ncbi:MAG: nucleoside 2-deoxyribosyltransferase domain-containing protein [Microscillaceae bacterium]|jgi:hypothetical protein|nr:nucleoside 2-deoxyribosyltransferase domain-containing protein [Microscillaceae bacterium]
MQGIVLLPPDYQAFTGKLVFLAGPIQGAPDWQADAIKVLQNLAPTLNIASPRKVYLDKTFQYAQQVDWETYHLRKAAETGAIMFWLAQEAQHFPERAYAQTSRFELGEWKAKSEAGDCQLIIGIEKGFSNERYIRHRLAQDCPQVPICDSLVATCEATLRLLGF